MLRYISSCGIVLALALGAAQAQQKGARVTPVSSQKKPNVPGKTMTVVTVEFEPGAKSAPHRHPASGMVFAYVITGAVRTQVEGEPVKVVRAGESWSEPPNAHHVVSENASAS